MGKIQQSWNLVGFPNFQTVQFHVGLPTRQFHSKFLQAVFLDISG